MPTKKTNQDPDPGTTAGGALAGGAAGAGIGAVVGGPVGAAVGGAIGATAGAATGAAVDYDTVEPEFQEHYRSSSSAKTRTWEQAGPAYRYGWEHASRPDLRGRSYTEVQADLKKNWTGGGTYQDYEPMVRAAWEKRAQHSVATGGEAVVPIVEEELQVGKRKVETGGVKVKTTIEEKPVQANVSLHKEEVNVSRRPVSRAADADDIAFKEGTIELTETAEEAVVAKKARVVEEVVISKEGSDRTETVRDTVRKTDVDVQKTGGKAKVGEVHKTGVVHFDDLVGDFRASHKSTYGKSGQTYETYSPAYRYGYDLANDKKYAGSDWSSVEADARKSWEKSGDQGAWEDFKDAVQYGWDKVRGKH